MGTDQRVIGVSMRGRLRHLVGVYNQHWHHLNETGRILVADSLRATLGDCADMAEDRRAVTQIRLIIAGLPSDWVEQVGLYAGRKRGRRRG